MRFAQRARRAFRSGVLVTGMVATLLAACAQAREERLQLRIRNSGEIAFEHVWQGLPTAGTDHDFGRIEPGQTSHWHAFPAQLPHYRKTRLQPAQGRQFIDVIEQRLLPGRYTLDYALHDGRLRVRVIDEGAPDATE